MICCGQFITRIAKRMGLLTDEVLNSLSAMIYCRALDAITLKELIGHDGRLIVEDQAPGGTLERIAHRQLYHSICMLDFLSTWLGTMDTHYREIKHHQGMTRSSRRFRSGVEKTRLDFVTEEKKSKIWKDVRIRVRRLYTQLRTILLNSLEGKLHPIYFSNLSFPSNISRIRDNALIKYRER
ncbi:hypothetical protein Tco_1390336 [Tanacetum coccineum]